MKNNIIEYQNELKSLTEKENSIQNRLSELKTRIYQNRVANLPNYLKVSNIDEALRLINSSVHKGHRQQSKSLKRGEHRGRPTPLDVEARVLELVAQGETIATICQKVGLSAPTVIRIKKGRKTLTAA